LSLKKSTFHADTCKLVIPTVGWITPDTYDICFSGLRDGGVFIISSYEDLYWTNLILIIILSSINGQKQYSKTKCPVEKIGILEAYVMINQVVSDLNEI